MIASRLHLVCGYVVTYATLTPGVGGREGREVDMKDMVEERARSAYKKLLVHVTHCSS